MLSCPFSFGAVLWQEYVKGMFGEVTAKDLEVTTTHLSSYFNRYYNNNYGVEAVDWMLAQYKAAAGARTHPLSCCRRTHAPL